ncbi:MAG: RsmD family RNA methyltransferase [Victivallaceae bacterium]|nr:RsmD family RNA methyltransferase [Victivallaceae bacterium]
MNIISGIAGGIRLNVPKGIKVRPTSGRARKALYDSIGDFNGKTIVDLFAGSGALGLEAASRGAARVIFVEKERKFCRNIEENIAKVKNSGIECRFDIITGDASNAALFCRPGLNVDIVLADPPYPISGECFQRLGNNQQFAQWLAGAELIWEFPDTGDPDGSFLTTEYLQVKRRRNFGGTTFIFAGTKNKKR